MAVAGLVAEGETTIEGAEVAEISYPNFWDHLHRLESGPASREVGRGANA